MNRKLQETLSLATSASFRAAASVSERIARLSSYRAGIVMCYHGISETERDPNEELVQTLGAASLESHVRFLKAQYRVVPASDLLAAVRVRTRGQRFPIAITFDDDLRSHVRVAMPILQRYEVPATFFITGASLSGPATAWWWDLLQVAMDRGAEDLSDLVGSSQAQGGGKPARRHGAIRDLAARIPDMAPGEREEVLRRLRDRLGSYEVTTEMQQDEVKELVAAGFDVQCQTLRHDSLPTLGDGALAEALVEGRDRLASIVGHDLNIIAYPYGRADARVAEAARSAGYVYGFTSRPVAVRPLSSPLLMGRVAPYRATERFALQLVRVLLQIYDADAH